MAPAAWLVEVTAACGRLPYSPFSSAAIVMALGGSTSHHMACACMSVKLLGPFMMKVAEHPCRDVLHAPAQQQQFQD